MIAPILGLIGWTCLMWFWLYATRLPAMRRARTDLRELGRRGGKPELPPEVNRVADNYNHLHEQPTLFYALALAIEVAGWRDPVFVGLAWAYVGSRVLHSLVQATVNIIPVRFALFALGSLLLMAMLIRAALRLG
jgi:hypothetical protein